VKMDRTEYAHLLLSSVFGTRNLPLTHSLINHPIKRRITMLYKTKGQNSVRRIIAASLAVVIMSGIVMMQSCQRQQDKVMPGDENVLERDKVSSSDIVGKGTKALSAFKVKIQDEKTANELFQNIDSNGNLMRDITFPSSGLEAIYMEEGIIAMPVVKGSEQSVKKEEAMAILNALNKKK
jgi:hypothetical protein